MLTDKLESLLEGARAGIADLRLELERLLRAASGDDNLVAVDALDAVLRPVAMASGEISAAITLAEINLDVKVAPAHIVSLFESEHGHDRISNAASPRSTLAASDVLRAREHLRDTGEDTEVVVYLFPKESWVPATARAWLVERVGRSSIPRPGVSGGLLQYNLAPNYTGKVRTVLIQSVPPVKALAKAT